MPTRPDRVVFFVVVWGIVVWSPASPTDARAQRAPLPAQCTFNDECSPGLICFGGMCRAQCRTARDCPRGDVCQSVLIDGEERVLRTLAPGEAVRGEPGLYVRNRCVPAGFEAPNGTAVPPAAPPSPGVVAPPVVGPGTPVAPGRSQTAVEPDTNRYGDDYKSFETTDGPNACVTACSTDDRCRSWTWVKPGAQSKAAVCWLKDAVPPAKRDACCASGVKR